MSFRECSEGFIRPILKCKVKEDRSALESFNCEKTPELYHCKRCDFRTDVLIFFKTHEQAHLTNKNEFPVEFSLNSYICNNCTFETHSVLLWLKHNQLKCSSKNANDEQNDWATSETFINGGANDERIEGDQCIVTESEINSVHYLLKCPVPLDQKRLIYAKGRPTPDLVINYTAVSSSRTYNRAFNKNIYDKYEWMCGCTVTNKLYCFVCSLFRKGYTVWTTEGVNDLKHIAEKAKKHEESIHHVNAWVDYELLRKIDNDQLNTDELQNKLKHNENVGKNRHILQRLIMCIKFCGAFEIASDNPGIYGGLINFAAELDSALAKHMKNSPVLDSVSKTVQNDLLDAMFEVYRDELIKQIKSANFVALEADEITDSSNQRQIVIILRYVHNGEICERFWSFVKLEGHTVDQIADVLLTELQQILEIPSDKFKLIAQSYDGSSIMSGRNNSVQAIIRKTFPHAYFVHCYAHEFNFIIEQAVLSHKKLKLFFGNLQSFTNFFSQSSNCTGEVVYRRLPGDVPIGSNFKTRTVNTLSEYKDTFRQYLKIIIDAEGVDSKTISEASELLILLKSPEFLYWLKLFNFIMPHVEMLVTQTQNHGLEKIQLQKALEQFEQQILCIRSITANIEFENQEESDSKRQKISFSNARSVIAKEVCDNILTQIKDRFDFKAHLSAAKLFHSKEFKKYKRTFPQTYFDETVTSYPMLNSAKLRIELAAIYAHDDMCGVSSVLPLLVFIADNNLKDIFSETYKLLDIICTTPMPTNECERCFSTLTRIKTFLRNTRTEDRLNALAVLSTEKKFVQSIVDFDNKVIEVFCNTNDRRADLFLYE